MYPPHLLYLKEKGTVWFNPSYGLRYFWEEQRKLAQKFADKPFQYVWDHRELKRAKEIYAMSIIAKAMSKSDQRQWWMIKPQNDPPDGVIGTIMEDKGFPEMCVREVEIVEHKDGNLLDTVRKKLSSKQYEPNTILVCYISQGGVFDFKRNSEIILQEATSLDNIFFVFPGLMVSDIPKNGSTKEVARAMLKVSSVQIKPIYSMETIDPIEDTRDLKEQGAFFIFEGVGKSGSRRVTLENPPKLF
ncbi:MAG: hypothetical protein A2431_00350 [Candidatus Zambryskibacteria bacterium RIFOXYC1_FULL_39_10]|uniref:Uncharacterized protein n=1 Tax=Candidatus Zambryskibacteria bacterium RIFOXYC1_FULL_39_10 TaxID=1802779 RepID=A0A1G2UZJ4_9BACT|nr:MAG: hypothetical protein A2431_00350 [Candidatus Zambryskibacteria bacterium RIFOXYC1_FULL_39_10]OHB15997.1 MAG: hypothetical protein A2605_03890 [Candidatus Zambryskibacteria bacterium RIFOXYD1_FULL_39_35]